ncbi:DDE_Tnp_1_7 domain-containing protein [Trichonephila clavipes]|nr:DDE_Tnp_1_7 domain-containing protein [Trichonephila clavipes]
MKALTFRQSQKIFPVRHLCYSELVSPAHILTCLYFKKDEVLLDHLLFLDFLDFLGGIYGDFLALLGDVVVSNPRLALLDSLRLETTTTKNLWDKKTGRNIFLATMSLETFCTISRVIRFDNKSTRQERRKLDKLATVRDIWEKWIEILPK